jgi:hypothetical protein
VRQYDYKLNIIPHDHTETKKNIAIIYISDINIILTTQSGGQIN